MSWTLVVAGVISDGKGKVLLGLRPEDRHLGGLWEFPGGKIDANEQPREALARELSEELGIEAEVGDELLFATHIDDEVRLILLFYAVRIVAGEPQPLDGQRIAWVEAATLDEHDFPPADKLLVERLAAGTVI